MKVPQNPMFICWFYSPPIRQGSIALGLWPGSSDTDVFLGRKRHGVNLGDGEFNLNGDFLLDFMGLNCHFTGIYWDWMVIIWLVVWTIVFHNMCNRNPNWLIFFRGIETTNQLWYLIWIQFRSKVGFNQQIYALSIRFNGDNGYIQQTRHFKKVTSTTSIWLRWQL